MQDTNKHFSAGRRVAARLTMAVALVAGIASVALASPPNRQQHAVRDVFAQSPDYTAYGSIGDNGDGTATVNAYVELGDGTHIDVYEPAVAVFWMVNDLKSGKSTKGSSSGSARAEVPGVIHDPVTDSRTPVTVVIDIAVANASDVSAWMQHGVSLFTDPGTGETHAVRGTYKGNQAYGNTSGALTVTMDGVIVSDTTDGFGAVGSYADRSLERID